jgi:hypothetical protein
MYIILWPFGIFYGHLVFFTVAPRKIWQLCNFELNERNPLETDVAHNFGKRLKAVKKR